MPIILREAHGKAARNREFKNLNRVDGRKLVKAALELKKNPSGQAKVIFSNGQTFYFVSDQNIPNPRPEIGPF